jgi:hypothetical protein
MNPAALYHLLPSPLSGDTLYPLNRLKELAPEIYRQHVAKYKNREELLERRIPFLDCLWNDVLHLSPVHPALIRNAKLKVGLTWPANGRAVCVVNPDHVGMTAQNTVIWHNEGTTAKSDLGATPHGFSPFLAASIPELSRLPEKTLDYYAESKRTAEPTFLFVGIPHILYRGAIRVEDTQVIVV